MPSAAAPNARTTASAMAYHQPASIPGRLGSRPGRACPVAPLVGKGSDPPAADLTTKKGSIREGWCVNDIVLTAVKMIYLKHQRVPPSRHTPSTNLEHGPDAPHSARSRNVFLGRRARSCLRRRVALAERRGLPAYGVRIGVRSVYPDPQEMALQGMQTAVHGQGRHGLRAQSDPVHQMAPGLLAARQHKERNVLARAGPRPRRDAENRVVHVPPESPRDEGRIAHAARR